MSEAKLLRDVQFWQTNDPTVCGIELVCDGHSTSVAVTSQGLAAVIGKLLDQASNPEFKGLSIAAHGVQRCHIDGNRIELNAGRSPTECAVTLTIGCVQLVAFFPLRDVAQAFVELRQKIEPLAGGSSVPH